MRVARLFFCLALATPALAQPQQTTGQTVGDIATTPLRDTNIKSRKIPDILERAAEDPYAIAGLRSCAALNGAIGQLSAVLGADFDSREENSAGRGKRMATTVARGVVEGLIPFRGVVREVTGAAGAQRRYDAAVDAGIARRGFLRGTARARGCRPAAK